MTSRQLFRSRVVDPLLMMCSMLYLLVRLLFRVFLSIFFAPLRSVSLAFVLAFAWSRPDCGWLIANTYAPPHRPFRYHKGV